MPAPTITALPEAPLRTDEPALFTSKAEAFVDALEGLPAELNAFGTYLNEYEPTGGVIVDDDETLASGSTVDAPSVRATKVYVDAVLAALVDAAPGTLDTLNELAAALADDPNFAATVTTALAGKLAAANNLSDLASAATARSNLGVNTRRFISQIVGSALTASEVLFTLMPPTGETWTFAGNLAGSSGKKTAGGTNPASAYTIDLQKNGASVGSISISTAGAVSFSTTSGDPISLTGGTDILQAVGPASTDTAVGYVLTLVATFS